LPKVLEKLEDSSARYVLTIHSRPKAVLIGTEAFLELLRGHSQADRLLALQLGALAQGLEATELELPGHLGTSVNELVGAGV
jgi:hypothetical protein